MSGPGRLPPMSTIGTSPEECKNHGWLHMHKVGHRSALMENMAECLVGEVLAGTLITCIFNLNYYLI